MIILLVFATLVNIALVLLTAFGTRNRISEDLLRNSYSLLEISVGLWTAIILVVMGYMMDFERMMFYAIFIGVCVSLTMILGTFLPIFITGGGIFGIGLVLFVRFLNRYPLPRESTA